jgi:hypothetical protein
MNQQPRIRTDPHLTIVKICVGKVFNRYVRTPGYTNEFAIQMSLNLRANQNSIPLDLLLNNVNSVNVFQVVQKRMELACMAKYWTNVICYVFGEKEFTMLSLEITYNAMQWGVIYKKFSCHLQLFFIRWRVLYVFCSRMSLMLVVERWYLPRCTLEYKSNLLPIKFKYATIQTIL